jgi:3-dehydroquinate synthase
MPVACRFGQIEQDLIPLLPHNTRWAVDENVYRLHREKFTPVEPVFCVPSGEKNKTLRTAEIFWEYLWQTGADRKTTVVAVGGGVTTDLIGFSAATWMRGIPFLFVPTTLLGMVDAAVGGKTAVDLATPHGTAKNLVGVFAHPTSIFYDVRFLSTLPERERRSGMVEALKHGLVADYDYFHDLSRRNDHDIREVVRRSYEIKTSVVESDPFESGRRKILNFGHTVGHALESLLMPTGILHGEAVAWGMAAEIMLSVEHAGLDANAAACAVRVLEGYMPPLPDFSSEKLKDFMLRDKKNENEKVLFTLLSAPGVAVYNVPIDVDKAAEVFDILRAARR